MIYVGKMYSPPASISGQESEAHSLPELSDLEQSLSGEQPKAEGNQMSEQKAKAPFYVITRGRMSSYVAVVHRAGCSFLDRAVHAKPWNRNPLDEDKFNNYEACSRCRPKRKEAK